MPNIWLISGGVGRRDATYEYYRTRSEASARAAMLETVARKSFEELDARIDLGVTWDQYQEIQGLAEYKIAEVPHGDPVNSHDDAIPPTGDGPTGRIWLVLEGGRPEGESAYLRSEEDAKDRVWSRNWAGWEYYVASTEVGEMTFAEFRATWAGHFDVAPADLGLATA